MRRGRLRACDELGLVPGIVEPWEDGRRNEVGGDRAELWHFDGSLSNGANLALGFCIVGADPADSDAYRTDVNVMVTAADGQLVLDLRYEALTEPTDPVAAGTSRWQTTARRSSPI